MKEASTSKDAGAELCFVVTWRNEGFLNKLSWNECDYKVVLHLKQTKSALNQIKCEWPVEKIDYLGFILTTKGLKPMPKKVESIINMDRPTNTKQAR